MNETPPDVRTDDEERFLEEQRDFLLTSLRDLEAEYGAGDIDEDDYRTLRSDYTTRAAEVLRELTAGEVQRDSTPPAGNRSWKRRVLAASVIAVVAVGAGVLVAQSSGRRGSSGPTGLDVSAASSRLGDCQEMETESELDLALDCYGDILESLPANVGALTFRGWLQVRSFDAAAGLADLDQAVTLAPDGTAAYIFRASGRARSGDAPGAIADLARFYDNDPSDEERGLADGFAPTIVSAALDACIAGDVSGSLEPVDVADCYRNILTVDPGNASASVYLGWLSARTGLTDEALTLLDVGLEADPELTAGYVFRAATRAHGGDTAGALADLDSFDARNVGEALPESQVAAAAKVRATIEAGGDPLG